MTMPMSPACAAPLLQLPEHHHLVTRSELKGFVSKAGVEMTLEQLVALVREAIVKGLVVLPATGNCAAAAATPTTSKRAMKRARHVRRRSTRIAAKAPAPRLARALSIAATVGEARAFLGRAAVRGRTRSH